jgi:hypothetical protein
LNLLPLFPIGLFIYYLVLPRLSPPTPEEILATSNERRSRTKEAAELSKQLKNSSAGRGLGFAAEVVRGVFVGLKERLPTRHSQAEEKNLANALGSTALVGGLAGGAGNYNETLRQRLGESTSVNSVEKDSTPAERASQEEVDEDDFEPSSATDETRELSLYRLVRNLASSFGPPIQTMMNESIDLLEMSRK